MKKCLFAVLALCLLLAAGAAMADTVTDQLMAEPWESVYGIGLTFGEGGKGTYNTYTTTYTVSGNKVSFTYVYWMDYSQTETYYLIEKDGFLALSTVKNGTLKTSLFFRKSEIADVEAKVNAGLKPQSVKFGQTVDAGPLKINLKEIKSVSRLIGTANNSYVVYPDNSGAPFLLIGTVKNTGKEEINLNNLRGFFTVGGETLSTSVNAYVLLPDGMLTPNLPGKASGTLYIVRNLTDRQRAALAGATLTLAFYDDLNKAPFFMGSGDHALQWKISAERAKAGADIVFDKEYYTFFDALPMPGSYILCSRAYNPAQTVNSNQLLTALTYSYTSYAGQTGKVMQSKYVNGLKADGFTIRKNGDGYRVYQKKELAAEVSFEGDTLKVTVFRGTTYFKESPALAEPGKYVPCELNSMTISKKNSKTVSYEYRYSASYGMKASKMVTDYANGLKKAGYTVEKSGSAYKISYKNKLLAVVKADKNDLLVQVQAGNEKIKTHP